MKQYPPLFFLRGQVGDAQCPPPTMPLPRLSAGDVPRPVAAPSPYGLSAPDPVALPAPRFESLAAPEPYAPRFEPSVAPAPFAPGFESLAARPSAPTFDSLVETPIAPLSRTTSPYPAAAPASAPPAGNRPPVKPPAPALPVREWDQQDAEGKPTIFSGTPVQARRELARHLRNAAALRNAGRPAATAAPGRMVPAKGGR